MVPYKINLISSTLPEKDKYFNVWHPCPDLTYIRPPFKEWTGVTVVTDELIAHPYIIDNLKSTIKIAWLIEPPVIKDEGYKKAVLVEDFYDCILTYDEQLLSRNPKKYQLLRFGAVWIEEKYMQLYPKTKSISMILSNKTFAPGHILRHQIYNDPWFADKVDFYGTGSTHPFEDGSLGRLRAFRDYKYSIVLENCRMKDYFTDKILDCFATGTIPIYWGATNALEIFDGKNFLTFTTIEELKDIITNKLSEFDGLLNFELCKKYASPDANMLKIAKGYYNESN